ncbi:MAG TPA: hypothetical protein VNV88_02055, partial [Candidatus Solibacter sp.]|nr:hypothetical protein [Candidatus Solibacter sp.]
MMNVVAVFTGLLLFSTISFAQSISVSSPSDGATVSSPVHFVGSANGGSFPATAVRVYVDNQSMYTTNSANLDTFVAIPAGNHFVVVQGWNSAGQIFKSSMNLNVSSATAPNPGGAGVSVASPANGATAASPVQFVASATPNSGRVITAMRIYVDSGSAFTVNASSLNTSLGLAAGGHSVVVQAWDNTGTVYKQALSVNVSNSAPPPNSPYQANINATGQWISANSIAPDGAILFGSSKINPYFSNLAAIGMTRNPANYQQVQNWMQWYINHLNWPDKWGLLGTMYDYDYNNGAETSLNNADSTDSYAATFLSVAWAYYSTGDANAQAYVKTLAYQLDAIGGVIVQTQQADGLTWAKPDYQIKYLMDNCEAYRGLRDLALLFGNAFNDAGKQQYYNAKADLMLQGIQGMWMNGTWAVYKDGIDRLIGPNMGTWYPDASSQMFPVMQDVISPSDPRSKQVYDQLLNAWPGWANLSFNSQDPFPWVMIADAAAVMGDTGRVGTYINAIQNQYVKNGFPWPFYSMEAGWFMRLNAYMLG